MNKDGPKKISQKDFERLTRLLRMKKNLETLKQLRKEYPMQRPEPPPS